jgi:hypothetical protein
VPEPAGVDVSGEARGWLESSEHRPFYHGRHHTTVLDSIKKVERLRKTNEAFDALRDVLTATLMSEKYGTNKTVSSARSDLIEAVALKNCGKSTRSN